MGGRTVCAVGGKQRGDSRIQMMGGGIGTRKHVQQLPLPARDVVLRQGLGELLVNQLVEKFEPETDGLRRGRALLLSGPLMDGVRALGTVHLPGWFTSPGGSGRGAWNGFLPVLLRHQFLFPVADGGPGTDAVTQHVVTSRAAQHRFGFEACGPSGVG